MPIRIAGEVMGSVAVQARFQRFSAAARQHIGMTVKRLGFTLERNLKSDWLNGRVLHRRSGRLSRSINTRFIQTTSLIQARVGTSVFYGRAWELGFSTRAHDIYPKTKQALFWPGAQHPVRHVHIPAKHHAAKPWMKPAFAAFRPIALRDLKAALLAAKGL